MMRCSFFALLSLECFYDALINSLLQMEMAHFSRVFIKSRRMMMSFSCNNFFSFLINQQMKFLQINHKTEWCLCIWVVFFSSARNAMRALLNILNQTWKWSGYKEKTNKEDHGWLQYFWDWSQIGSQSGNVFT